jgi:CheY-like chemotaxis protein
MSTPSIIIIFEPDPMISGVLRVEFSRWDFAVLLANSSQEAEAYASQAVASLVVLDVGKVPLATFEACARIRHSPGYAGRPIVLTTPALSERTKAAAATAGATVLLAKPYSMMDLFQAITPDLLPDDPLLIATAARSGTAAPVVRQWTADSSAEWRADHNSALSRNKSLLPIVRAAGKKIPLYRIS